MHTFHVGYVGLILNIRYLELLNFFTGWFGLDLTGEDADPRGKWPWQSDYSGNMPERLRNLEAQPVPPAESPLEKPRDEKAPAK